MSVAGCMLDGRYQLQRWIAAGAVGEVWQAADHVLGRRVAVKLLRAEYLQHAEALARFRAEARHAGSLSHPGIAHIYDYRQGDPPESPYLVMEFVDGPSLTQVVRSGPLGPARTMDVVAQAAAALAAAHAAGLVHRDIKPGNLLIGPGGKVKVTDFGIAYAAGSAPLTQTGMLIGTPAYIAPERVDGSSAGPASDLYSLGIVAYECLTGAVPFTGSAIEVALAHQRGVLPPLPEGLPEAVTALVAALTAKNPADRPGSAAEVAASAAAAAYGDKWPGVSPASVEDAFAATLTEFEPEASAGAGLALAGRGPRAGADVQRVADAGAAPVADAGAGSVADAGAGSAAGAGKPPSAAATAATAAYAIGSVLRPESWVWLRRGRPPGWASMAAVSLIVAAALIGWLIASMSGSAPPRGASAAAPTLAPSRSSSAAPTPSSPAVHLVSLSSRSLVGKPVAVVIDALRDLDLNPRVAWTTTGAQPPGMVVSIRPAGSLLPESTVTVTAARRPANGPPGPAHHYRGHHHRGGHGGGSWQGGGGD